MLHRRFRSWQFWPLANVFRQAVYLLLVIGAATALFIPQPLSASFPRQKGSSAERIDFRPKLTPGEVLVYQIQLQTITDTKKTGAISDPEGPSRMVVTWDARVKLQVLGETAQPSPGTAVSAADLNAHDANKGKSILPSSPLRIRTTYERSAATVKSDSPDPQAEGIEQSYKRLEGQVIEFTIGPAGHVSDVEGLKNVVDSDQVRQAAEQWMAQVSGPAVAPNRVAIGQTWSSTEPADSMPLAGMIW